MGTIQCNACGHTERVHGFIHGLLPGNYCMMSYQCQSCAKFVDFNSEPVGERGLKALEEKVRKARCECGGRYARDKSIMCSRCKSVDVGYELEIIT